LKNFKQTFAAIIVSVLRTMDSAHFDHFFGSSTSYILNNVNNGNGSFKRSDASLSLISLMLDMFRSLLDSSTFSSDWFDLLLLRNYVILGAMSHTAEQMNKNMPQTFTPTSKKVNRLE
jgi:hypothetical protein